MGAPDKPQSLLLYESYQQARISDLTYPQFLNILNLYPSILVCMSDGILDKEEHEHLMGVAKNLAIYADEVTDQSLLEITYQKELMYLLENPEMWEQKFLLALKDHLSGPEGDKEFVLESMYLFANAANGISDVERNRIESISDQLGLAF